MDDNAASRRRATAAAVACALLSVGAIGAGFVAGPERALGAHLVEDTVVSLAWAALTAMCALRGRPFGVALGICAAWSVAAASNGWSLVGTSGTVIAAWLGTWTWAIGVGLAYTAAVLRATDWSAHRPLLLASFSSTAAMAIGFATLPLVTIESGVAAPNALALPFSEVVAAAGVGLTACLAFTAIAALALQMTSPRRRRRALPILVAAIAGIVGISAGAIATDWAPLVQVLTVPLLPVAIALAPTGMPNRVLRTVNAQLDGAADPSNALASTLKEMTRDLGLPGLAVEVDGDLVACVGLPGSERLSLVHLGRSEGFLRVPPTHDDDRAHLDSVAPSLAAVLASTRLAEEARRSRAELTVAREDERRRVRRDLHDEVGPLLSAAMIQTDVADLALDRSPERARVSLHRAQAANAEAVVALRRIVRDLHPAAVDDLGLVGALEELAFRLSGPANVSVTAASLPPLPAAVEVALYRIAAEAAGNAVRHATASGVGIHIIASDGAIVLTVSDDGCGFDASRITAGVGLDSMHNRAAELDGELLITSNAGGTEVRARIPVPR